MWGCSSPMWFMETLKKTTAEKYEASVIFSSTVK